MFQGIDFFSDTVTKPTAAMRKAMVAAEVGDEQRQEDPTTLQLEELLAEHLGFSAALFFPSATMANEIALRCMSHPGDELLAADSSHLFLAETGGPAVHAQLMCRPIPTKAGVFGAQDIKAYYHDIKSVNHPISRLLSVENTTNFGGGLPWSGQQLQEVVACANELNLKKHMDGARIFNASVKTGMPVKAIAAGFDMVTICLSKGLGCPVGAVLAFDKAHFPQVRRYKQLMGGAMRQTGILAAAGIYALQHHVARLQEDHDHATQLANALAGMGPSIQVLNDPPATNIVLFTWHSTKLTMADFSQRCIQKGVRFSQIGANTLRAVTHLDISSHDIKKAVQILQEVLASV